MDKDENAIGPHIISLFQSACNIHPIKYLKTMFQELILTDLDKIKKELKEGKYPLWKTSSTRSYGTNIKSNVYEDNMYLVGNILCFHPTTLFFVCKYYEKEIRLDFKNKTLDSSFLFIFVYGFFNPIPKKRFYAQGPFTDEESNTKWQWLNNIISGYYTFNNKNKVCIDYLIQLLDSYCIKYNE